MKSINANKTQKLAGFFDYLTQKGHQTEGDEIPEVYTNLEDSSAVGIKNFLNQYEKNFQKSMKSKVFRHNTKLLAKSMVFALPHGMTKPEIDGYVKAIAKALPESMTFAFALHRGSNKKTAESSKNLHLQGFLGVRGDGSEKFGADVRLPLHDDLVKASDAYIKTIGFKIAFEPTRTKPGGKSLRFLEAAALQAALDEGVSGNRATKTRQSELLRDPMWLMRFSLRDDINDPKLKQFCAELSHKRTGIIAERYEKRSEIDLAYVPKQMTRIIKKQDVAKHAKTAERTATVIKRQLPHRLREDRETREQYLERKRRERREAAPPEQSKSAQVSPGVPTLNLTEEKLEQALNKLKNEKSTNKPKRTL